MFTVQATGTEPLSYQWQHKVEGEGGEWQSCNAGKFPGANSFSLIIPNVQKADGGRYHCIVSNIAGSLTSESAQLSIGEKFRFVYMYRMLYTHFAHAAEPPRITVHPQELRDVALGKPVTITVQATGTEPLSYRWEIKGGNKSGAWLPCDVERFPGANSSTLTIPSIQKSNKESYRCVISNIVCSQISDPVKICIGRV